MYGKKARLGVTSSRGLSDGPLAPGSRRSTSGGGALDVVRAADLGAESGAGDGVEPGGPAGRNVHSSPDTRDGWSQHVAGMLSGRVERCLCTCDSTYMHV